MKIKRIIQTLLFVCIFLFIIYFLCMLFRSSNTLASTTYNTFYDLEEETVDAIIVGTSGIDRYWIPAKAYEEQGFTMYTLATNGQPTWTMFSSIQLAKEYNQDVKLVVVDMRPFSGTYEKKGIEKAEAFARQGIDLFPFFSKQRSDAIEIAIDRLEMIDPTQEYDKLSFYLPFIKMHSKWSEDNFTFKKLKNRKSKYMGFHMKPSHSIVKCKNNKRTKPTDKMLPLDEVALKDLYAIISYCEKEGYELLFVNTPHYLNPDEMKRMNMLASILEEEGIPYLNYAIVDESVYDLKNDFYNDGHVNFYGAEKFTEIFSEYIVENYDLPDRRNDKDVKKDWDGVYKKIKKKIEKWENEKQ